MSLLEIMDVSFRTKGRDILRGVSLEINAGEVHALIGTNGTGKSTLACLIMGCQGFRPDTGEILLAGEPIAALTISERARRGIAMAWQEPVRFEGVSVRQYLALGKGTPPQRALEMVGLPPSLYLERMVDKALSGGERKRIELASLLTLQPKLVILDEPDSGIDMLSTQGIIDVIGVFRNHGAAVLLITHREEIARIADRASQVCGGRIVCTGDPRNVATHYKQRVCTVCNGQECRHV